MKQTLYGEGKKNFSSLSVIPRGGARVVLAGGAIFKATCQDAFHKEMRPWQYVTYLPTLHTDLADSEKALQPQSL